MEGQQITKEKGLFRFTGIGYFDVDQNQIKTPTTPYNKERFYF